MKKLSSILCLAAILALFALAVLQFTHVVELKGTILTALFAVSGLSSLLSAKNLSKTLWSALLGAFLALLLGGLVFMLFIEAETFNSLLGLAAALLSLFVTIFEYKRKK